MIRNREISLSHVLIVALLGFLVSCQSLDNFYEGKYAIWHSLGKVPDKPIELIGISRCAGENNGTATIFIRTVSGRIYEYSLCQGKPTSWQVAELPKYDPGGAYKCSPENLSQQSYFSHPPKKSVDCYALISSWEMIEDKTYFVLFEDDTVWWWRDYLGIGGMAMYAVLCSLIGAIVGAVLSYIFSGTDYVKEQT